MCDSLPFLRTLSTSPENRGPRNSAWSLYKCLNVSCVDTCPLLNSTAIKRLVSWYRQTIHRKLKTELLRVLFKGKYKSEKGPEWQLTMLSCVTLDWPHFATLFPNWPRNWFLICRILLYPLLSSGTQWDHSEDGSQKLSINLWTKFSWRTKTWNEYLPTSPSTGAVTFRIGNTPDSYHSSSESYSTSFIQAHVSMNYILLYKSRTCNYFGTFCLPMSCLATFAGTHALQHPAVNAEWKWT
jgi:hypothetical protein